MSDPPIRRRAYLGMPGRSQETAGTGRGLWRASQGVGASIPIEVTVQSVNGSLLAHNFNVMWCWVLNEWEQGRPVHYFAMLHSDVIPDDGWLDVLIEELEARDLDVLGTVIPIKDPQGITSVALARDDGDPWRPHCRLTLAEIARLPETFTNEDVGRPLLINTGCWVCRFDPAWAKQVHFTINDRIVFNNVTGVYRADVESEDWHFSRQCHTLNLKIGITRKVGLDHAGDARFTNRRVWGAQSFDQTYVDASPIAPTTPEQTPN